MLKILTLLMLCIFTVSKNVLGMNANGSKPISGMASYFIFKHTCPASIIRQIRTATTSSNPVRTLAFPNLDVISYCALKDAKQELMHNRQALHDAYEDRDLAKFELLLAAGAPTDTLSAKGYTVLHRAASNNRKHIAEVLLHYKADVDARDAYNWTPLCVAAHLCRRDIAELLLNAHATVDVQDDGGVTPLYRAASYGHEEIVELLLNHNASLEAKVSHGWTPLHVAVHKGRGNVVRLLLSKSFFLPTSAPRSDNNMSSLQEVCLNWLFNNLDDLDEDSLKNDIVPCIGRNLGIDPMHTAIVQIIAHHAPLTLQRHIVKLWKQNKSAENDSKITFFIEAHGERHLAKIKKIMALRDRQRKTARDRARENNYDGIVKLFDHVAGAQMLCDLDGDFQQTIRGTLEKHFAVS